MTDNQLITKILLKNLIMRIKDDVTIFDLDAGIVLAITIADNLFYRYFGDSLDLLSSESELTARENFNQRYNLCILGIPASNDVDNIIKYVDELKLNLGGSYTVVFDNVKDWLIIQTNK